jgi:hypothetical protein
MIVNLAVKDTALIVCRSLKRAAGFAMPAAVGLAGEKRFLH